MLNNVKTLVSTTGFALLLAVGCGPNVSDPGDNTGADAGSVTPGSLVVTPGDVILEVENGVVATQVYTVQLVQDNGSLQDVTANASLSVGLPSLGSFTGNTFTTAPDRAGRSLVTAVHAGKMASANLTVKLSHVIVTDGAPSDANDQFDGASTGGIAPTLVYPTSGVILPPNMNTLEFHFLPGAGNNLFQLEFIGGLVNLRVYLACTALAEGCVYSPDESTWELLATAGRGDEPLFYTISGLGGSGSAAGTSDTHNMTYASDDMLGGIYYWSAGAGAIMRYEFGRRGQNAETFLNVAQTAGTTCVGCHSLSRDGKRIAVGLDIPGPAGVETFGVADRNRLWGEGGALGGGGANFFSFSPDASKMLLSNGANIVQRDTDTGANSSTVIDNGTMPDWSPDGTQVVYARPQTQIPCPIPQFCGAPGTSDAEIVVATVGTWTDGVVVATGNNNYYPAFSPDGEWIIFNKTNTTDSFDALDAEVWVVHKSGGNPIRLANAAPPPGGDSWPKWAPYVSNYKNGKVMWLTFSSRRDYGLRLKNSTLSEKRAQVWMVGFDPALAQAGMDPSFASFWLPFQDINGGNHIAQWVEEVERQDCKVSEDCPGNEFCEDGVCLPYVE